MTLSHDMERRIEDARLQAAARALAARNQEMVTDTGIVEPRSQRDECWMLLMKALQPNARAPITLTDLEKLTLRNGVPLLILPNGWNRVNEIGISQYGLRSERAHYQNWMMRPEFAAVDVWDLSERQLGHQIDTILDNWNPNNLMKPWEENDFYKDVANLQEEMVYKTVAERVGVLGSQIDADKKAKIEEVVPSRFSSADALLCFDVYGILAIWLLHVVRKFPVSIAIPDVQRKRYSWLTCVVSSHPKLLAKRSARSIQGDGDPGRNHPTSRQPVCHGCDEVVGRGHGL